MSDFSFLDPFQTLTIPLGDWVETVLNYMVQNFREVFRAIRWPIDQVLKGIEYTLQSIPPSIGIILSSLLGWQLAGKRMALLCFVTLTFLGLIGVWSESMTTLALVLTSVFFCALIGIPLGIVCARSDGLEKVIRPILDAMQTLPAFVYLVPVVMLFGIGNVPGVVVTIVFALLSGINYATHYLALMRRSTRPYARDPEIPFYFAVLAFSILMLTVYLLAQGVFTDVGEALRYVAFHVVSISTSLGLVTHDYTLWPMFAQIWILFLGSFIACSGSTGGGIKMMRAMILYKQVFREIVRSLHPNAVRPVRMGRNPVPENILHAVLGFSFMYMVSIVSLTLVLSATGLDLLTAFSAVVACLNNTGPGLEGVGPASNYQALEAFQKWVLAFAMILGRLEIFTLLVVLTPTFWRR